jgi:hypothetical protein
VIVRLIALLMLIGTIYVAYEADRLGWSLGITAQQNPFPWIILATGLVASLLTFSMGLGLSMLCAIYDQQEIKFDEFEEKLSPKSPTSNEPQFPQPTSGHRTDDNTTLLGRPTTPLVRTTPKLINTDDHQAVERDRSTREKSGLWGQLTRERHFSRREGEPRS